MKGHVLGEVGDGQPMVQLATVIPQALHRALKCQAITEETPLRDLVAKYLQAGLKASRA